MIKLQIGCLLVLVWALFTYVMSPTKSFNKNTLIMFILGIVGAILDMVSLIYSELGGPIEWYVRLMYYGMYFVMIGFWVLAQGYVKELLGRKQSALWYIPAAIGIVAIIWLPIDLTTVYSVNYAYGGAVYAGLATCMVYCIAVFAEVVLAGDCISNGKRTAIIGATAIAAAVLGMHLYDNGLSAVSLTLIMVVAAVLVNNNDAYNIRELLSGIAKKKGCQVNVDGELPEIICGNDRRLKNALNKGIGKLKGMPKSGDITVSVKISQQKENSVRLYFSIKDANSDNEVFFHTWQRCSR